MSSILLRPLGSPRATKLEKSNGSHLTREIRVINLAEIGLSEAPDVRGVVKKFLVLLIGGHRGNQILVPG